MDWNLLYLLSSQDKATAVFKESESKLFKIRNILSQFKENVVPVRQSGEWEINGMIDFSDCI